MKNKIKEAISVMHKAYNQYIANATKNLDKNEVMYWYWHGVAEGTRRSFELLEEIFGLSKDEKHKLM